MASIKLYEDELLEKAIKRFKKSIDKEGILKEYKERQYFLKPSTKKHVRNKTLKRKAFLNILKAKKKNSY